MSTTISITAHDGGRFEAHVSRPAGAPRAAVIVLQEVFGVNAGIQQKCDRLAEAGYLAVAPDLFWRIEPGIDLDPDVEAELARGLELAGEFDQDAAVRDIEATIRTLRGDHGQSRVGAVGYCMGGRLAYFAATRTDVDASVGYYAVGIADMLDEAAAIARPLMLHIAGDDHFVPKDQQAAMHAGLDGHAKVVLHDYPGCDHGFATETGRRRDAANAELADRRTADFLREHLG